MTDPVHDPNPRDPHARDPNVREPGVRDDPRIRGADPGPRGPARAAATLGPESAGHREHADYERDRPPAARAEPTDTGSVAQLLRRLVDDVATLLRKEMALATSEISHSIDDAKQGAASMVIGGAILYLGLVFLLLSATLGLAQVMPGWAAALIVGGVVALIGVILLMTGRNKVQPSVHRTSDAMRKDRDMIERQSR
ncbi:MAG: phage holin family protein [Pseudomonadales bacterium]